MVSTEIQADFGLGLASLPKPKTDTHCYYCYTLFLQNWEGIRILIDGPKNS